MISVLLRPSLRPPCLLSVSLSRYYASKSRKPSNSSNSSKKKPSIRYNYNANPFDILTEDGTESSVIAAASHPLLSSNDLSKYKTPPKRFKALTRDFIHDSLYNPNYGYFTQQAVIFDLASSSSASAASKSESQTETTLGQIDFNNIKNGRAFDQALAKRYGAFEGPEGLLALPGKSATSARQVWHTPTELFQPFYARAVAKFLYTKYKMHLYPYEDLNIYEVGAGNGTLMRGILDYLQEVDQEVYQRTHYNIIEISPRLSELQQKRAGEQHESRVKIINFDIFDWNRVVPEPCFFLAFEVLDNLSHDIVRYTNPAEGPSKPLQCLVNVTSSGDYQELYTPVSDPLINDYLEIRNRLEKIEPIQPVRHPLLQKIMANLPFSPNMSSPIYIPTKLFSLLRILKTKFPNHRMLLSDFSALPDSIPGINSPVVQTRYKGQTVPCTTYLVSPGYFDIFFPTDFQLLSLLYEQIMNSPSPSTTSGLKDDFFTSRNERVLALDGGTALRGGKRKMMFSSHRTFLEKWAETEKTELSNGENPMLEHYENAMFAWTAAR